MQVPAPIAARPPSSRRRAVAVWRGRPSRKSEVVVQFVLARKRAYCSSLPREMSRGAAACQCRRSRCPPPGALRHAAVPAMQVRARRYAREVLVLFFAMARACVTASVAFHVRMAVEPLH